MAIEPGTRFGPYEIMGSLGAGGMGEVYRARDTKLDREVAIKTLPSALAQDPERLARFEREAKLLATLNHAHIGAIYGLDEYEGTQFIVMELVEGETLEEKLKAGALPLDDGLRIALQIAEALEAAHDKGVVHRDLKPANVMLTRDGVVKVLDFGLAKAFSGNPNEASPAHSPALSMAMTQAGLILGTAGYMSPEQASGQATDQRADIWAFGVVLYEMLTGLPLFSGESVPHILADVLRTDPDWSRLPKNLHPRLRLLLERCLEKKPRDRYHSIADARVDLEKILHDPRGITAAAQTTAASKQTLWRKSAPVVAAMLLSGVVVGVGSRLIGPQSDASPRSVDRFAYRLPEGQHFRNTQRRFLALSPNGREFVYNTQDGFYVRSMSELEPRLIVGTELQTVEPSFSPDSQSLAYSSQGGEIRHIAISGGVPFTIASGVDAISFGLGWAQDNSIFFSALRGIYRVSANGGTPELVVPAEINTILHGARLLPDEDSLLFSLVSSALAWDKAQVVVQSLTTDRRTVLFEGGADVRYVPTGHLVYGLGDTLFARAFDPDTLTVSGTAVPVLRGVVHSPTGIYEMNFDVADDGTLVYASGEIAAIGRTLVWVDRAGREEPLAVPARNYVNPRISPDGARAAIDIRDQSLDIWSWDLNRQTLTRLTFDPAEDEFPVWSPDGTRIAFASTGRTDASPSTVTDAVGTALYWRAADGTGTEERLAESSGQLFSAAFLPDASAILVFGTVDPSRGDDIGIVELNEGHQATPLLDTTFEESYPQISPDGRWLAYTSTESDEEEVYVRPFPNIDDGRWQISTDGGTQPLWAHNRQELFYRSGDAVMSVSFETNPTFTAGTPRVLFEGDYIMENGGPNYDVAPDDERFLMIKQQSAGPSTEQIIIVKNWFEELRRLVPTE